jgi:hypothetical protein
MRSRATACGGASRPRTQATAQHPSRARPEVAPAALQDPRDLRAAAVASRCGRCCGGHGWRGCCGRRPVRSKFRFGVPCRCGSQLYVLVSRQRATRIQRPAHKGRRVPAAMLSVARAPGGAGLGWAMRCTAVGASSRPVISRAVGSCRSSGLQGAIARGCSARTDGDTMLGRAVWVRDVRTGGDDDPRRSKFGGTPLVLAGQQWPRCSSSGLPLLFLCQFSSEDTPAAIADAGMLQFFVKVDGRRVSADEYVCSRVVQPDPESSLAELPADVTLLEAVTIDSWERQIDYPGYEDDEFPRGIAQQHDAGEDAYIERFRPLEGLKLQGWPLWVRTKLVFVRVAIVCARTLLICTCGRSKASTSQLARAPRSQWIWSCSSTPWRSPFKAALGTMESRIYSNAGATEIISN